MRTKTIEETLPTLPELSDAQADALYAAGHKLYQVDKFRRAADVFRLLALARPLRGDAWWALAACHEQLDDFAVAARLYSIGFRLGGQEAQLGLLCARARARAGDLQGARAMLDEVIEVDPSRETLELARAYGSAFCGVWS